jgi:hypothetical protein
MASSETASSLGHAPFQRGNVHSGVRIVADTSNMKNNPSAKDMGSGPQRGYV